MQLTSTSETMNQRNYSGNSLLWFVNTDAFITCVVGISFSGWWTESFHDIVQRCHYQCAWLVSSWLIRFGVGQVVLSGRPWSTSSPILWALSGSAVSMQSWTIKGKSFWPPAYCGKVQFSLPLLIWTNLGINGHLQAGSSVSTTMSRLVTSATLIFPISRDRRSERGVQEAMRFSIHDNRRK